MKPIAIPTENDWNTLNELKLYEGRDFKSANEYYDFEASFDWRDYKYKENDKTGVKDIFGKIVVLALFDDVLTLSNAISGYLHLVAIAELNKKYALVLRDGSGRNLTPFVYDEIEQIDRNHFYVCKAGKYGIINDKGQDIFPCILDRVYTDIVHLPCDVSAVIELDNQYGFVLKYTVFGCLGAPILLTKYVSPKYEAWSGKDFDETLGTFTGDLRVKKDGKWGYIDKNAEFTVVSREAYVGDEFRYNEAIRERGKYYRRKWWDEHPDEDKDIYYEDDTNFEP